MLVLPGGRGPCTLQVCWVSAKSSEVKHVCACVQLFLRRQTTSLCRQATWQHAQREMLPDKPHDCT